MNQEKTQQNGNGKQAVPGDNFWTSRRNMLAGVFVILVGCAAGLAAVKGCYWDEIAAIGIAGLLLFLMMLFYLESNRIEAGPYDIDAKEYKKPLLTLALSAVLTFVSSFLPEELFPVLLISLMCSAAYDRFFGMFSGCVFLCFWYFAGCGQAASLAAGIMLVAGGSILSFVFEKKQLVKYGIASILAINVAVPLLVRFFMLHETDMRIFLYSLLNGAFCAAVSAIYVPYLNRKKETSREEMFAKFLSPDYPLLKMMSRFSKMDYEHAKKVSGLCGECAVLCNANQDVARMGGMYYRIGRMQGEPYVENGVKLALDFDFPYEVYRILKEYNGEECLPSSIESAIVHIVDCVVTKLELFDEKTFSSTWNREMLIYQTLNEKSSSGIYDDSGLSMNLFLKLREYLAKEGT